MDLNSHQWETGLRTLEILHQDLRLVQLDQRWKALLAAVHRRWRQEQKRKPEIDGRKNSAPLRAAVEPPFLPSCLMVLRRLSESLGARQFAAKNTQLPQIIRAARRELRLDLRGEPRRAGWRGVPFSDQQATLQLLQAVKDDPASFSTASHQPLWLAIDAIRRKARRITRQQRAKPDSLELPLLQQCGQSLPLLTAEPYPDWDYHEFKGLLAKVERAFVKDEKRGVRFHSPDSSTKPQKPGYPSEPPKGKVSWWMQLKRWLAS